MTTIHLDPVGGVAGDMFVAAMLDALPDLRKRVLADAAAVLPPGAGSPAATTFVSPSLPRRPGLFRRLSPSGLSPNGLE